MAIKPSTRAERRKAERRKAARQRKANREPAPSLTQRAAGFVREIVVVLAMVLLIQTFAFASFYVPTPSMESNILVGDRIFVSKLHYGPRLPTALGIPYTNIFIPGLTWPALRLPGFSSVKRGDVVVFNYPPEESPISKKEHYVKRAVGLPGDQLEVRNKVVYINGAALTPPGGLQQHWVVTMQEGQTMPWARFRAENFQARPYPDDSRALAMELSEEEASEIRTWTGVEQVEPFVLPESSTDAQVFPTGSEYNVHHYGPLPIPAAGDIVELSEETWPVYEGLITRFEGHEARRLSNGQFEIDGAPATQYTVEQDYYFMMGDNRDNSLDSRAWGFVPADHVVGKAVITYFSLDKERGVPRFGRIGHLIR